ncbi:MAG: hypothetical protein ACK5KO_05425 [Arachnia sp.]
MAYRWEPVSGRFDRAGLAAEGLAPHFDDQSRAEQWLGEFFDHLAAAGVTSISLYEEDRLVYGPMLLEP